MSDPNVLSDRQLKGLADQAFDEMREDQLYKDIENSGKQPPQSMTAMAIGKEVYFASGTAGHDKEYSFFYDWLPGIYVAQSRPRPKLLDLLQACQVYAEVRLRTTTGDDDDQTKERHRIQARCGEPMIIHLYHLFHPDIDLNVLDNSGTPNYQAPLKEKRPRIATVAERGGASKYFWPPCGPDATEWGDFDYCAMLGITTPIPKGGQKLTWNKPYEFKDDYTVAGHPEYIDICREGRKGQADT